MWQPIETAPTNGTEVLVYREDSGVFLARWIAPIDFMTERELEHESLSEDAANEADWFYADFVQGGRLSNDGMPTHWMPLPDAPETKQ